MSNAEEEKFLREKQEYEDALAAYREILGRSAQTLPSPYSMTATYGNEGSGPAQAATDPWIEERFPDLATAARRVQAEEADYFALDDPFASHAQGNCSISQYTINKVYEYYAALEMVYKLATDEDFRKNVVSQLHPAFRNSAIGNQTAADMLNWRADEMDDAIEAAEKRETGELSTLDRISRVFGYENADALSLALMGYESEDAFWADQAKLGIVKDTRTAADLREAQQEMRRQADIYQQAAIDKVKDFFAQMWEDIKRRYAECGLFYAVVTTGIDGVFLAGEVFAGVAILRGLKFVKRVLPGRRVRIEVTDIEGRQLADEMLDVDALEAKYGTPQENHLGGYEPDRNRDIPDKPADEVLEEKRRTEQADERRDVREDGSYRNPQDPEGVRRAPDGEAMVEENGTWKRVSETSNNTKGRFGETMADDWAANQTPAWEKVNGPNATMDTPGHTGLDSVYKNPNPPPDYFVTDAKYGTAGLGKLVGGTKQMSPAWIRERVEATFSRREARRILDSYEAELLRVDKDGNVARESLEGRVWREEDL